MHPLQKHREQAGLSIQELADKLDMSPITIWRWETWRRELRHENRIKVAKVLGCTPRDLVPEEEVTKTEEEEATSVS